MKPDNAKASGWLNWNILSWREIAWVPCGEAAARNADEPRRTDLRALARLSWIFSSCDHKISRSKSIYPLLRHGWSLGRAATRETQSFSLVEWRSRTPTTISEPIWHLKIGLLHRWKVNNQSYSMRLRSSLEHWQHDSIALEQTKATQPSSSFLTCQASVFRATFATPLSWRVHDWWLEGIQWGSWLSQSKDDYEAWWGRMESFSPLTVGANRTMHFVASFAIRYLLKKEWTIDNVSDGKCSSEFREIRKVLGDQEYAGSDPDDGRSIGLTEPPGHPLE